MADDNSLRSHRPNDPYRREAPQQQDSVQGADPLAELARLIGQSDPFNHPGREPQRSADLRALPADDWRRHVERPAYETMREPTSGPAGHDPYRIAAPDHSADYADDARGHYREEPQLAGAYDDSHHGHDGYDDRGGYSDDRGYGAPLPEGDDYDDPPRSRRSGGLVTAVLLIGCAMLGTAGAYGYRSYMSGPSQGQAPVIVADRSPNKVVPAPTDPTPSRAQERFTGSTGDERLVSREEQPVALTPGGPPRVVLPAPVQPGAVPMPPAAASAAAPPAARSSDPSSTEPRRVRTVIIRPDGSDPSATPQSPADARSNARTANPSPTRGARQAPPPAETGPLSLDPNAPPPANTRAQQPQQQQQPRSLTPPAPRAESASPAARVAAVPAAAPSSGGGNGNYVVQVSSQRSEADAQSSYRALQAKYPQLRDRQPIIRRADLGAKGTFYRAMVGPFGSAGEANEFCGSLKAAGGQCLTQRN